MESVFEPEFSVIVVTGSYSNDDAYQKLKQIEARYLGWAVTYSRLPNIKTNSH